MQHVKNTNCPICNAYLGTKPWNQLMYTHLLPLAVTRQMAWAHAYFWLHNLRPDPVIEDLARKFLPDFKPKEDKEGQQIYMNFDSWVGRA